MNHRVRAAVLILWCAVVVFALVTIYTLSNRGGQAMEVSLSRVAPGNPLTDKVSFRLTVTNGTGHAISVVSLAGRLPSVGPYEDVRDAFLADAELIGDRGPVVDREPSVMSLIPPDEFAAEDVLANNPRRYAFATGEAVEVPFRPLPPRVSGQDVTPGVYQLVAVVTWLDADTGTRRVARSAPLEVMVTPADVTEAQAQRKRAQESFFGGE